MSATPFLIDSHCHLDFPDFASELPDVIARANAAGVRRMVTISTKVARFDVLTALATAHMGVYCTVGTHPNSVAEEPDVSTETLIRLSQHPLCVGIGEAGLDYYYDKAPRQLQEASFRRHIAAARETGLPLVIHARNADADMEKILIEETGKGAFSAILHCFSSTQRLADVGVELGLMVSFSGILTFKNSQEIRDIAQSVPLDRLLVETDAPYLAPGKHRGKRNEPSYVVETAKVLADVKGVDFSEMQRITTENCFRTFSKMPHIINEAAI